MTDDIADEIQNEYHNLPFGTYSASTIYFPLMKKDMNLISFEFNEANTELVLTFTKEIISAREAWKFYEAAMDDKIGIRRYLQKTRYNQPHLAYQLTKNVDVQGLISNESDSVICQIRITFDCTNVNQVETLLSREMLDERDGVLMHATHRIIGFFDMNTYPTRGVSFFFSKMRQTSQKVALAVRQPFFTL